MRLLQQLQSLALVRQRLVNHLQCTTRHVLPGQASWVPPMRERTCRDWAATPPLNNRRSRPFQHSKSLALGRQRLVNHLPSDPATMMHSARLLAGVQNPHVGAWKLRRRSHRNRIRTRRALRGPRAVPGHTWLALHHLGGMCGWGWGVIPTNQGNGLPQPTVPVQGARTEQPAGQQPPSHMESYSAPVEVSFARKSTDIVAHLNADSLKAAREHMFPVGPLWISEEKLMERVRRVATNLDFGGGGWGISNNGHDPIGPRMAHGLRKLIACHHKGSKSASGLGCLWRITYEWSTEGWVLFHYQPHHWRIDPQDPTKQTRVTSHPLLHDKAHLMASASGRHIPIELHELGRQLAVVCPPRAVHDGTHDGLMNEAVRRNIRVSWESLCGA